MDRAAPTRLAAYGTLRPGQANHHQLAGLTGRWQAGTVRGWLYPDGRGAAAGYPGIDLDPDGPTIAVEVLHCDDLPGHWARLDAFEGEGYRRALVEVTTSEGSLEACIYVLTPADGEVAPRA